MLIQRQVITEGVTKQNVDPRLPEFGEDIAKDRESGDILMGGAHIERMKRKGFTATNVRHGERGEGYEKTSQEGASKFK